MYINIYLAKLIDLKQVTFKVANLCFCFFRHAKLKLKKLYIFLMYARHVPIITLNMQAELQ